MKIKNIIIYLLLMLPFFPASIVVSQNGSGMSWDQFRGPKRNGISMENSFSDHFSETGYELLWKVPVGSGFSEITVSDGTVYTMFGEKVDSLSGTEYIGAFDLESGEEIWKARIDSMFFDTFGNGPRSTPFIDENQIYCFSSYGKLTAVSKMQGEIIWQVDFISEFGSTLPRWGFASSPILVGNTIIMEAGGTESRGFAGIDKDSGELLWTWGEGLAAYSSPVVANFNGAEQVIFASQTTLYSFNSDGDTLWTFQMSMNGPMASPVVFDSNKIFISTVRSRGFCIVEVNKDEVREILNASTMKNDFSSSVVDDGYIYGFNVAALQCVSVEDGSKKWTKRGFGKGSLILVGDNLLVLSDKGKLITVKATPEAYTELHSFQALEGKSWTAPSFSGGKVFLRNLTEMACYKIK